MALAASRQQTASRPRLLQAVFDAIQQPDIRKKLLFTAAILVVFRFIAHIPIPGVDPRRVREGGRPEPAAAACSTCSAAARCGA